VADYMSEKGRYERRLEVNAPVDQDEVLVKLPLSHVLSSDFCKQDLTDSTIRQVVEAQKKNSETIEISPWTWITLYMIAHSKKSECSWLHQPLALRQPVAERVRRCFLVLHANLLG